MQWWPARMATASRSSSVATSWGCASGRVKVTMPARSAAVRGPWMRMPGTSRGSISSAYAVRASSCAATRSMPMAAR